ncbi:MAG: tRNA (adenosine(37)-N6)-threonylcarbamoyltransferase complex ATPase subunit type 1 TsaE [Candidatus Latescibacteria bacterium]|nr:tRNA (adenosine(37)-N6)-threonylcarbamoyltransferase complex ATPase subunit type 1 TsaE [Candidatus Latescibacterota bacterium]
MEFHTKSSEETIELGEKIGAALKPGDILAFYGELGSGKTTMIKGIALGLGVKEEDIVKSPSFIMVNEYKGQSPIFHIDLYRVKNLGEVLSIGFDDYLYGNGVCLIEWAEKAENELPQNTIKVELTTLSFQERKITISGLTGF